ncbi:MAG: hypothetical protein ACRDPM_17460 [Solirubrobacteraceae bacterium]
MGSGRSLVDRGSEQQVRRGTTQSPRGDGGANLLRLQRSVGNRAVGRILARDTPEPGSGEPTEVALSPQEMWDRVLAERGMASRVPPHRVEVTDEELKAAQRKMEAARQAVQHAGENPDLQLRTRKGEKAQRRQAAQARLTEAQDGLETANRELGKAQRAARSAQANRSGPVPPSPETVDERQLGHGVATYAAVQVTDGQGKRVAFGIGAFDGKQHAEEMALRQIREELTRRGIRPGQHGPTGWKVTVVVDQHVCDERCRPALRQFADDYGIDRDEVRAYYPERVGADPKVSPKTASKTAHAQETRISSEGEQVIATGEHPYRLKGSTPTETPGSTPTDPTSRPPPAKPKTSPAPRRSGKPVSPEAPRPPKAVKTSGGEEHAPPPKTSSTSKLATEVEQAAEQELSGFRRVAGKATKGLAAIVKLGVVPLQIALELLNAVQSIEMTESALSGNGWILTGQVAQAKQLSRDTDQLVTAYDQESYHADVQRLVDTALRNDEHYAALGVNANYWSSLDLSDFCVQAKAQLSQHVDQCRAIDKDMTSIMNQVRAGQKFCDDELKSDAVLAAEAIGAASGIPVGLTETLFMASRDLDTIAGYLGGPMYAMHKHLAQAEADLKLLDDNILTQGLADVQAG